MKKALLLLVFLFASSALPTQERVLLRIKVNLGQVFRYAFHTEGETAMSMVYDMKVTEIKKGLSTFHSSFDSFKFAGQPAPAAVVDAMKKMKVITVLDERGRAVKTEVLGAPGSPPDVGGSSIPYPQHPIAVGQSWTATTDYSGKKMVATYSLVRLETIANRRAAILRCNMSNLPDGIQYDVITSAIELETGMPISLQMTGSTTDGESIRSFGIRMTRL